MTDTTPKSWIAVACHAHVRRGLALGIMQVCHGKAAPLRRLRAGDRVAYYSPAEEMRGGARVEAFTAYGIVEDEAIEQVDMGGGFRPFRRRVRWLADRPAPVRPLVATPGFALEGPRWGAKLRYGLVPVDAASMDLIAAAMSGAAVPPT